MRIEGVTFDWWNTVALTTEDQDRRLRELRIERLRRALPELSATTEDLLGAYDRHTAVLQEKWGHNLDLRPEEQIQLYLDFAGIEAATEGLVTKVAEAFGGALLEVPPKLFPHVPETLEALRMEGVGIGLVSNTGRTWGRYLRLVQDRLGIGRFFDARGFSDETGVRKPEPGIFRVALDGLGLAPERVAHVGDDLDADVSGSKALGMKAVWFNTGRMGHRPGYGLEETASGRGADAEI